MSKIARAVAGMPTPRWVESKQHWRMDCMYQGHRKIFYSSNPSTRTGPSECRLKYNQWVDEIDDGITSIKFKDAWTEYVKYYGEKYKKSSTDILKERGKTYLLSRFANRSLSSIKRYEWQKVIDDEYEEKDLAYKTLSGIETTIRTFCKFCAGKGYIRDEDVPLYFIIPAKAKNFKFQYGSI